MRVLSYWLIPVFSGLVWLGGLMGLLLYWAVGLNKMPYPFMMAGQTVPFISDVAAGLLKPLFITVAVVTSCLLDVSFGLDIWLRRCGRLAPNITTCERVLQLLSVVFAAVGTVGLICLSIFDNEHYKHLHEAFLGVFIAGFLVSAIFLCWEYQRLGMNYREHRVLRLSFWLKLAFILLEVAIVITWAALIKTSHRDAGAIMEWIIAFVFSFYVFSFAFDLYPAVRTHDPADRFVDKEAVPAASL